MVEQITVLEVAVSVLGNRVGSYVLEDGVLRWEGGRRGDGSIIPEPFDHGPANLDRGILATDDYRDGWIEPGPDPERWLRRVPGFLAMRGILTAEIVPRAELTFLAEPEKI